jgi:CHAD domain-containing protein
VGDEMPKLFRVLKIEPRPRRPKQPFDALRALLREQLDQILAHDPGTRLGDDPESLHAMRVAVRRSRALLRAGAPLVASDTDPLRTELQWLGTVLGDVRDLDVLLERLRGEAATLDPADHAAAGRLLRALARQRTRARRVLLKALDSQRYADLLDLYEATLEALEPSESGKTLAQLARREARSLRDAVRALGDDPLDEQLHDLRKRGKRTRYAYELSGEKRAVRDAKAFQDVLGEHQDAVMAEERLRGLAQDAPGDQALAAGLLIERERARRDHARAEWRKVWRQLERSTK